MTNREIDALVAEHCMGWITKGMTPHFSTDPAASKQLRDRMREDGWNYDVHGVAGRKFHAEFYRPMVDGSAPDTQFDHVSDTEESAIALAALAALGVEVPA